jgi:hypothetical protein
MLRCVNEQESAYTIATNGLSASAWCTSLGQDTGMTLDGTG